MLDAHDALQIDEQHLSECLLDRQRERQHYAHTLASRTYPVAGGAMPFSSAGFKLVVIGDIIIDHDILVQKSSRPHTNLDTEIPYEVERRYTTVGGAGGSARALAMLNGGETHLAGFSAPTIWGENVREILDECRKYDDSPNPIRPLVVWAAEGRGAVVSRLVVLDDRGEPAERPSRWDDASELALPDYKRQALPGLVKDGGPWEGILLSDLNRGTIDRPLVESIAEYASSKGIPFVIVPKWIASWYHKVEALAVIPNLKEWCELIKTEDEDSRKLERHFRHGLPRFDLLEEMARRSVTCFPQIRYHIVTCDTDGLVVIGPVREGERIPVSHLRALPSAHSSIKKGAGDVFSAQFLLAYLQCSKGERLDETEAVHQACRRGTAAAAAHLKAPWHRMATADEVKAYAGQVEQLDRAGDAPWPIETAWAALGYHINLGEWTTALRGIVSQDEEFKKTMVAIVSHLERNKAANSPRSLLIGAPSGDGKSALLAAIRMAYSAAVYEGCAKLVSSSELAHDLEAFQGQVVLIDEADKAHVFIRDNIGLFQSAIDSGILFVFVGSGLVPGLETNRDYAELYGRCERVFPKPLVKRLGDIVLILAARIAARIQAANLEMPEIHVEKAAFDDALRRAVSTKEGVSGKALDEIAAKLVDAFVKDFGRAQTGSGRFVLGLTGSRGSSTDVVHIVPPPQTGGPA